MIFYFIMADLTIKEEIYDVANLELEQVTKDLNDFFGEDGWYDDIEDAKEFVSNVRDEYEANKSVDNCVHVYQESKTLDESVIEVVCLRCGYNYLKHITVL